MSTLGKKMLKDLKSMLSDLHGQHPDSHRLYEAVCRALAPKRQVIAARKRKRASKAEKRSALASIRSAVMLRAGAHCEACGMQAYPALQLDHMFGGSGRRLALQSVYTCWALCPTCHQQKTDNTPTAAYWLEQFAGHCRRWWADEPGYLRAAEIAWGRLDAIRIQERLPMKGHP